MGIPALCCSPTILFCFVDFVQKDWISEGDHDNVDCKNEKKHTVTSLGFTLSSETCFPLPTLYIFVVLCNCGQFEVSFSSKAMVGIWAQCHVIDSFDKHNWQQDRDDFSRFAHETICTVIQIPLLKSCLAFLHWLQFKFVSILHTVKIKWLYKAIPYSPDF